MSMHLISSRRAKSLFTRAIPICLLLGASLNSQALEYNESNTLRSENSRACPAAPTQLKAGLRELGGGECHSYEITLSANHFLHIAVEQKGIDVVLVIYGKEGTKLAEVDRPNGSRGPETISLIAPIDGSYFLHIRSYDEVSARGTYDLAFLPPRVAVRDDAAQINAERLITEAEKLRLKSTREAIAKFRQAADVWRSLGKPYEEALALYGVGFSSSSIGENQAAIDHLSRALQMFVRLKNTWGEAMVKAGLGWPYLYLADLDNAFESFSAALQFHHNERNVRGEGIALYGLGWVYAVRGEDEKALEKFTDSLVCRRKAMDRKGEALTLTGIGKIESRLGEYARAIKSLNVALDVLPKSERYSEADILSNLGWVYRALNENDKAISFFENALTIRKEVGDSIGEATTRYGMSMVLRKTRRLAEAEFEIEKALKIIELLRAKVSNQQLRISYFASVQEYYEFYITLLIELDQLQPSKGYAAKALHACERARARGLLDLLAEAKVDLRQGADGYAAFTQLQPLTAAEIQNTILDDKTVLLQYVLSEGRSYLLAVTSEEITTYELPPRAHIEKVARRFYDASTFRNHVDPSRAGARELRAEISKADSQADELAQDLTRLLLEPARDRLTKRRLVIVASGALQLIPFAALPHPLQDSISNSSPLIEEHEIIVLPSVSALAAIRQETRTRIPPPKTVVVIGDPVFDKSDGRVKENVVSTITPRSEFPRLISSRWEGEGILALVPSGQGKLVVDFAANRSFASSAEVSNYRFVHFATHAVIDFEHPALSGIVLSMVNEKGKPEDGFLALDDIFKLRIPVDLVVLSGCRTALGRDYAGEGLVGLTRGFMYAGASRVAVSLWQVADKPTSELMVRFYRYMLGPEKLTPAAALRAAQLDLRRDPRWRSPYFWAPFILQGDWR